MLDIDKVYERALHDITLRICINYWEQNHGMTKETFLVTAIIALSDKVKILEDTLFNKAQRGEI